MQTPEMHVWPVVHVGVQDGGVGVVLDVVEVVEEVDVVQLDVVEVDEETEEQDPKSFWQLSGAQ
jgi:hypothetical protein